MRVFDSHAHLNDERFVEDVDEVLERGREAGVERVVAPGYEIVSARRAIELARQKDGVYGAAGISPHEAKTATEEVMAEIEQLVRDPACVAVGEIGLDYHYEFSPKEVQKDIFRRHLQLAKEVEKPIIIHLREAGSDLYQILEEESPLPRGGVLHCFTGSSVEAKRGLDLGLYISFSGILVFAKGDSLKEVAASIPRDRLLIETDSPYLAPPPWRGKRNEPAYILKTLELLSELHHMGEDETAELTWNNASNLFGLATD